MLRLWIALALCTAVAWPLQAESKDAEESGDEVIEPAKAGTAEAAVRKLLEAVKEGDIDTFLDHVDLRGMYDMMKEQLAGMGDMAPDLPEFAEWEREFRQAVKKDAKPNAEFEYEILEVKEDGDKATAKVKTKESKDAEWEENTLQLRLIDGVWKITAESLMELSA